MNIKHILTKKEKKELKRKIKKDLKNPDSAISRIMDSLTKSVKNELNIKLWLDK